MVFGLLVLGLRVSCGFWVFGFAGYWIGFDWSCICYYCGVGLPRFLVLSVVFALGIYSFSFVLLDFVVCILNFRVCWVLGLPGFSGWFAVFGFGFYLLLDCALLG